MVILDDASNVVATLNFLQGQIVSFSNFPTAGRGTFYAAEPPELRRHYNAVRNTASGQSVSKPGASNRRDVHPEFPTAGAFPFYDLNQTNPNQKLDDPHSYGALGDATVGATWRFSSSCGSGSPVSGTVSLWILHIGEENPRAVAILSIDLVKGFTQVGVLASRRIAGIVPQGRSLVCSAHALGVRDFVLLQHSHPRDSPQFEAFGSHCEAGTEEEETISELASLPFAEEFTIMRKRSLSPAIRPILTPGWMRGPESRPTLWLAIAPTCALSLAMHVKMRANAMGIRHRVIVPETCVQTYDLSVDAARELAKRSMTRT